MLWKPKGAAGVGTGVLEGVAWEGSVFYFLHRIELIWMRSLFLFTVIITCVGQFVHTVYFSMR